MFKFMKHNILIECVCAIIIGIAVIVAGCAMDHIPSMVIGGMITFCGAVGIVLDRYNI